MFEQKLGFYPTPRTLGRKLIEPYSSKYASKGSVVLEPSAGKGDLAKVWEEAMKHKNFVVKSNLHVIEIQPEFQPFLSKEYTLVGHDFLAFEPNVSYDLIFMNPPFNAAEDHLLKAWDVSRGGDIACIVPDTLMHVGEDKKRVLIRKLVEQYGSYEYHGKEFADSERRTQVEIGIIRLNKPYQEKDYGDFSSDLEGEAEPTTGEFDHFNFLTNKGRTESLVESYEMAKEVMSEWLHITHKLCFYADTFLTQSTILETIIEAYKASSEKGAHPQQGLNIFSSALQKGAWKWVFDQTKFADLMTSDVKAKFEIEKRKMGGMPFTLNNIRNVLTTLIANRDKILHDCIVQVHELFRSYAPENTAHWEGWKTNSAYRVKEKVIIPGLIKLDWGKFSVNYDKRQVLNDIDRALCLISGKNLTDINGKGYDHKDNTDLYSIINNRGEWLKQNGGNYQEKFRSEFFEIRMYKKGTVHLTFLDKGLLDRFNIEAARGKNWLPDKGGSTEGEREKKLRVPKRPDTGDPYAVNHHSLKECKYVIRYGSYTSEVKKGVFKEGYSYDRDERQQMFAPGDWIVAEGYVKGSYKRYSDKNTYLLFYVKGVDGDYLITDGGSFYNGSVKKLIKEI